MSFPGRCVSPHTAQAHRVPVRQAVEKLASSRCGCRRGGSRSRCARRGRLRRTEGSPGDITAPGTTFTASTGNVFLQPIATTKVPGGRVRCPERAEYDSPGQRPGYRERSRIKALKGRNREMRWRRDRSRLAPLFMPPFQGLDRRALPRPRALPWAELFSPFRAGSGRPSTLRSAVADG